MPKLTVRTVAAQLNLTEQRVRQLLAQGRIRGAQKVGRDWVIPPTVVVRQVKMGRPFKKRRSTTALESPA